MAGELFCCIKNGKIVLENEVLHGKVLLFNHKIIDMIDETLFKNMSMDHKIKIIDAHGKFVSPGFIDIHIHGSGGKDTMDGDPSDLRTIGSNIAKNGVTGFLPTTMTMKEDKVLSALHSVKLAMREDANGAKVLGAHMEGPFISEKRKGAQNADHIIRPDPELIKDYLDVIKIVSMAPEEDPGFEFIKYLKNNSDIVVSIGHTNSDYETAMEAIRIGVSHATHLFNAMPPFHHRNPGAVGAALKSNISFELIADTLHIHPALFQILLNAKGKDKMILVTDSIRAGGMGDGPFQLGGQEVYVNNRAARLKDGTLAGSTLRLNEAVYNLLRYSNLQIYEAVALASLNPARLLGMHHAKGSIKIGKDADLIVFDEYLEVKLTILGGNIIYKAKQER